MYRKWNQTVKKTNSQHENADIKPVKNFDTTAKCGMIKKKEEGEGA